MSYTYSGNPATSPVDETHFLLGNTDPSSPIATDEECAFALIQAKGNTYLAAASVAETKAVQFAIRPTMVKKGERSTSWGDAVAAFKMLATTLRMQASLQTATVYAGGLSEAEHDSAAQQRDLVQPFATKNLHTTHLSRWAASRAVIDPYDPRE